jgi:predicted permease
MHTLSPGTLSPAFSVLSDPVFTVISVCVGAAENTSVYVPVDIVAFIFFVFLFIYTDWISVFACVADTGLW